MEEKKEIYLDYHATTPVLPEVMEAMSPYFINHFGNANSEHPWGWKAERAVMQATKQVADLIGAQSSQIYYTSGATESLHWAIVGFARKHPKAKIITTTTEHKATYGACDFAQALGAQVVTLAVDEYGRLDLSALKNELADTTPTLLSFIYGNNEVGTLNPMQDIVDLKNDSPHLVIHVDAAQCVGKVPLNFTELNLDLLSFSGHKLYAPKGIGALVMAKTDLIKPLFTGGGQQRGQRAGTTDVPSIVGLGAACQWASDHMNTEIDRLIGLRDQVINRLIKTDLVELNGHPTERLPNNLNFTFKTLTMDKLLLKLPKVGFSASSACSSGEGRTSHVLRAIGRSDQEARQTVRFGLGFATTEEDIQYLCTQVEEALSESKNFTS